jgi:PPOX class probable F420-dependent enzyme
MTDPLLALGDQAFIVLTTFRKTGVGVPTTVWVARDGDSLLVITPSETGKVKRIRNNGRVEVQASGRMGKVVPGAPVIAATAVIVGDAQSHPELLEIFTKKYGFEWKVTMLIERIAARRQKPRVFVRITPA